MNMWTPQVKRTMADNATHPPRVTRAEREDIMTGKQLIDFVEKDLCSNNQHFNAVCYTGEQFEGAEDLRVVFQKNHAEQYNRLLRFCADNNGIIIATHPGTLATTIRVKKEV